MTNEEPDGKTTGADTDPSEPVPPDPRAAIPDHSPPDPGEQLSAVKPSQQSPTDDQPSDPPLADSTAENGPRADGNQQAEFWVLVLFANVATLALAVGVLAWFFSVGQQQTLILLAIGVVAAAGAVRRYRRLKAIRRTRR